MEPMDPMDPMDPMTATDPMTPAEMERGFAAELAPGTVVSVLLEQHAKIRDLFAQTAESRGPARAAAFDELRELLAVHEAGEEIVVRPVTKELMDGKVADNRNAEEKAAAGVLAQLEHLDVDSPEFTEKLTVFEQNVSAHALREESEEFPFLLTDVAQDKQLAMGTRLLRVQRAAPTHPHPATAGSPKAQVLVGPFAAMFDRARDAFAHDGGA